MTIKKPNFLVLGSPKCGTTSLQNYFEQHPDVYVPLVKEANYFAFDIHKRKVKTESEYFSLFNDAKGESAIGEVSIWYLYSQVAALKIKESLGNEVKLIAMIRNPIQAAYSMHGQWVFVGEEDIENFEEALHAEQARKRVASSKRKGAEFFMYSEIYKYTEQLKRYFDLFGRDHIHIIVHDDLKKDTPATFQKALQFLEVKQPDFDLNFKVVNPHKKVKNKYLRDLYLKNIHGVRTMAKAMIPNDKFRRKLGISLAGKVKNLYTDYQEKEKITPNAYQKLVEIYKPEVEDLSKLLDRDFTYWLK